MTDSGGLWRPDWHLPAGVHAFVTTRLGGYSEGPWQHFNLGQLVGDAPTAVLANRRLLGEQLAARTGLATAPPVQWVRQVHGTAVLHAALPVQQVLPEADAIYAASSGLAIGVLTADCLPVVFCTRNGNELAVAHAGWRGLLDGVLEATVRCFHAAPEQLRVWLGPAIGPCHFEVGDEVRLAFIERADSATCAATAAAFAAAQVPGKWWADLYALARIRLHNAGIGDISGEPLCTSCNTDRFYSYRQQSVTGRFATLILRSG